MTTTEFIPAIDQSDADLVARTLAGDREAFSRIVARYQNLICSLAYSGIGHLGQSEDVAQETFITAWKRLRHLREPDKLRSWLCGILRNRIQKALHREGRNPVSYSEPLEAVNELPAVEPLPSDHAITEEEERILWRSLERIPETYRDPLVLYYRGRQSVASVAAELELTEDTVKQRLSRGRKLLQEEVVTFVERTLRQTAPGSAFSGTVLAALPVGPSSLAVSAVSKGAAGAKFMGTIFAPILGFVGGITAHWLIYRAAPTPRERRLKKSAFLGFWAFILGWCMIGLPALLAFARSQHWTNQTLLPVLAGFWWLYAAILATISIIYFRRMLAVRVEAERTTPVIGAPAGIPTGKRVMLVAGVYLACFAGLIQMAGSAHDFLSAGLLTVCMIGLGASNFFQIRNRQGAAALRAVAGHMALVWAVILVMVNWRVDVWAAASRNIDLAKMRVLLPMSSVHLLTLGLLLWIAALVRMTRSKRAA